MYLYLLLLGINLVYGAPSELDSATEQVPNLELDLPITDSIAVPNGRIVGGDLFAIEHVPYQVSLITNRRPSCGGAILNKNTVITAAHCLISITSKDVYVNAGSDDARNIGTLHRISSIKSHSGFKITSRGTPQQDIAILKVTPDFKFSNKIQPVPLGNRKLLDGQLVTVTGYGALGEKDRSSYRLRGVTVPVYNKRLCNRSYSSRLGFANTIGEEFFCAGHPEGKKDSCQGDSGGPAVINGELVGIVSFGDGCARPNTPGVYTDVSHYINWIKQHLN